MQVGWLQAEVFGKAVKVPAFGTVALAQRQRVLDPELEVVFGGEADAAVHLERIGAVRMAARFA